MSDRNSASILFPRTTPRKTETAASPAPNGAAWLLAAVAAMPQNPGIRWITRRDMTLVKPAPLKKPAAADVLSLKVALRNTKPPIWRRILMPESMTLADLHLAIQTAMGWYSCHLHDFDVDGRRYGDPSDTDDWDDEALADESRLRLSALAGSGVTRFLYTYDFGDRWQHDILIEKASPAGVMKARPACTAGKRNCPPEDCGGPWGYAELIEVLANPAHPRYDEQLEWVGDEFEPETFSVADADAALAAAFEREEPPPA
jgi:Plasmid pRiA4b ORF-3-like protein